MYYPIFWKGGLYLKACSELGMAGLVLKIIWRDHRVTAGMITMADVVILFFFFFFSLGVGGNEPFQALCSCIYYRR